MAKSRLAEVISRREWLGLAGAGGAGLLINGQARGESAELRPLNRFPRMLQEYYVTRVREIERAGLARRSALRTRADALAYRRDIRQRVRNCFGPFPEKTPLRVQITGTVDRESYRIEKILFESRPGLLVTGNLYLPKGAAGRGRE